MKDLNNKLALAAQKTQNALAEIAADYDITFKELFSSQGSMFRVSATEDGVLDLVCWHPALEGLKVKFITPLTMDVVAR